MILVTIKLTKNQKGELVTELFPVEDENDY